MSVFTVDGNSESIELRNFNRGTSADTDPEMSLSPRINPLDDDKLSKSPSIRLKDESRGENTEDGNNATEGTKEPEADNLEGKNPSGEDPNKARPWHTLVSYVDELTVGGRRNSKGHFIDGIGTFPFAFGRRKAPKIPDDCFPRSCYKQYVIFVPVGRVNERISKLYHLPRNIPDRIQVVKQQE